MSTRTKYPTAQGSIDVNKMVELGIFDKDNPQHWKALSSFNMDLSEIVMHSFSIDETLSNPLREHIKGKYPTEKEFLDYLQKKYWAYLKECKISYHDFEDSEGKYVKVVFIFDPGFTAIYQTEIRGEELNRK